MTRKTIGTGALCLAAGICLAPAGSALAQCVVFYDKGEFEQFNASEGKVPKGIETFEESNIPDGGKQPLPAPLEGNVPNVDPGTGFGFPQGLLEKNIIIQDNITPGAGPPTPNPSGDPAALYVIGTGFIGANSKKVGEDLEVLFGVEASLDLIFTEPNHTGVGFELSHFDGFPPGGWIVTIYNKADLIIGQFDVPEALEPNKSFFGVWCEETIGRINIWDFEITPDAVDNIQMWVDQPPGQVPVCPYDCAVDADGNLTFNKTVDILDFLSLLAQWGQIGTSCDPDNDGVGILDFLGLLAAWGPCPAPPNDECVNKIIIDRFDAGGTIVEHLDMYGATPSPEPSGCIPVDPNPFKDVWYCLRNSTNQEKIVTITTTMNVLLEVSLGCTCPPGPTIACAPGLAGVVLTMLPGDEFKIRLLDDLMLPNDELKGNLVIVNEPANPFGCPGAGDCCQPNGTPHCDNEDCCRRVCAIDPFCCTNTWDQLCADAAVQFPQCNCQPPGTVTHFLDPAQFFQAAADAGKIEKLFWDFKPNIIGPGQIAVLNSPLDINTHGQNFPDPWTDAAGNNLWPPNVDNVQFTSNLFPQGPLTPGGPQSLGFVGPGTLPDVNNNFLFEQLSEPSFDIISGPPAGDNHTAIAFEVMSIYGADPGSIPVTLHISVYDKTDLEIGKFTIDTFNGIKLFCGLLTNDPMVTIGRIDIWDPAGGFEGISSIWAFQQFQPGEGVNFFFDPAEFFTAIDQAGKFSKFFWNFKPDNVLPGDVFPIQDPLDIKTHPFNAPGIWDGLWPPEVDNVQFWSSLTPQGPLTPAAGLLYIKGPVDFDGDGIIEIDNNALVAEEVAGALASFNIVSGPPAGDNHTAFELEVVATNFKDPQGLGIYHVTVFDKQDFILGKLIFELPYGFKAFLGVVTKDPSITIGRVEIWDENGGVEGVSALAAYLNIGTPVCDDCADGTVNSCNADPNCHDCLLPDGSCVCVQAGLCDPAQQCDPNGNCPPGFFCCTNTCCSFPICLPLCSSPVGNTLPQLSKPGTLMSNGDAQ